MRDFSVSKQAAMRGNAAFLAPLICIVPDNVFPPLIRILSIAQTKSYFLPKAVWIALGNLYILAGFIHASTDTYQFSGPLGRFGQIKM